MQINPAGLGSGVSAHGLWVPDLPAPLGAHAGCPPLPWEQGPTAQAVPSPPPLLPHTEPDLLGALSSLRSDQSEH